MENQEKAAEEKVLSHNELIDLTVDKLKNNDFSVIFYAPGMNFPSGGIGVLLKFAKLINDSGIKVKVVYEPRLDQRASYEESVRLKKQTDLFERFNPTWLDFSVKDLEFIPLGDKEISFTGEKNEKGEYIKHKAQPLTVNPEDFLIIPEGFPDVMQKTMQVSCKRVVLAQSWFYVLNNMQPGQKWQHFGIQDVISVSDAITEFLTSVMPGVKIKEIKQGINREIFKAPTKLSEKFPMVAFSGGRGNESRMKTFNLIKTFYAFYPHLKWIRFIELGNMDREKFAETLSSCAFALYTDEIAGFGTLPLEAMACGTHVVGYASFGGKEYIDENNGFWTNNGDLFQAAEILGIAIDKWLMGELDDPKVQESYEQTLSNYTVEKEKENLLNIINEYKNERISELEAIKTK